MKPLAEREGLTFVIREPARRPGHTQPPHRVDRHQGPLAEEFLDEPLDLADTH